MRARRRAPTSPARVAKIPRPRTMEADTDSYARRWICDAKRTTGRRITARRRVKTSSDEKSPAMKYPAAAIRSANGLDHNDRAVRLSDINANESTSKEMAPARKSTPPGIDGQ